MAFLDFLFKRDDVLGSRVLICGFDYRFEKLIKDDSLIYKKFYPTAKTTMFNNSRGLIAALAQPYDIVHLFCDVLHNGVVADSGGGTLTGTGLIKHCCESDVKLLWVASNNASDRYINGFNAKKKRINLVMTIDRNGSRFSEFLEKLLFRIYYGDTLPVAWVDLCPQVPGASHLDLPTSIFYAGRPGVTLR